MNMTDPIADMLTHLRNAQQARHQIVAMPTSKVKTEIARILKDEGYIRNFKVVPQEPQGVLKIHLKYDDEGAPAMTGLNRVSKPGRRIYSNKKEIPLVLSGLGITIMTTSKGVMTGHHSRQTGVGGEVLCAIW
jgi:small subunit ribosomal protein S8